MKAINQFDKEEKITMKIIPPPPFLISVHLSGAHAVSLDVNIYGNTRVLLVRLRKVGDYPDRILMETFDTINPLQWE